MNRASGAKSLVLTLMDVFWYQSEHHINMHGRLLPYIKYPVPDHYTTCFHVTYLALHTAFRGKSEITSLMDSRGAYCT